MDGEMTLAALVPQYADDARLDDSGHVLLAAGQTLVLREPPSKIEPGDQMSSLAFSAIEAFVRHAKHVREIESDGRYSEQGKAEQRLPIDLQAVQGIAVAHGVVEREAAIAEAAEAAFYAVPEVAPSDSASAVQDGEIRAFLRTLGPKERDALPAVLAANPRMLLAYLRAPYLCGLGSSDIVARNLWRTFRENAEPQRHAGIQKRLAMVEWSRRAIRNSARAIAQTAKAPASEIFARLQNENQLAALGLFGIQDHDVLAFKRAA